MHKCRLGWKKRLDMKQKSHSASLIYYTNDKKCSFYGQFIVGLTTKRDKKKTPDYAEQIQYLHN